MEHKNIREKELIISLIKDDLKNFRLINGLTALGLNSGEYHLGLTDTIFKLIGVSEEDDEEIFEKYFELCEAATGVDIINYPELLNGLAQGIYEKLMKEAAGKDS